MDFLSDNVIEEYYQWVIPFSSLPWERLSHSKLLDELGNQRISNRILSKIPGKKEELIRILQVELQYRWDTRRNINNFTEGVQKMIDTIILERQISSNDQEIPSIYLRYIQDNQLINNLPLSELSNQILKREILSFGKLKTKFLKSKLVDRYRELLIDPQTFKLPITTEARALFFNALREYRKEITGERYPDSGIVPRWNLDHLPESDYFSYQNYFYIREKSQLEKYLQYSYQKSSKDNLYLKIPSGIFSLIISERDIEPGYGTFEEKASRLHQYDQIIIDNWMKEIIIIFEKVDTEGINLKYLLNLKKSQLYYIASHFDIDLNELDHLSRINLAETIIVLHYLFQSTYSAYSSEFHSPTIKIDPQTKLLSSPPPKKIINYDNYHNDNTNKIDKNNEYNSLNRYLDAIKNEDILNEHAIKNEQDIKKGEDVKKVEDNVITGRFTHRLIQEFPNGKSQNETIDTLITLAKYPINIYSHDYCNLRKLGMDNLTRGLKIFRRPPEYPFTLQMKKKYYLEIDFYSYEEAIFAISRGYPPEVTEERVNQLERYQNFQNLPHKIQNLLFELYTTESKIEFAKSQKVKFEEFLISIQDYSITKIAESIGMIIPPNSSSEYLYENIIQYRNVFERSQSSMDNLFSKLYNQDHCENLNRENLSYLTDMELFTLFGVYVEYQSRIELIENLVRLERESGFFIPIFRRCQNRETQLFTSTSDPETFIVGYGTVKNYIGYELDEFLSAFQHRENNDFVFMHPEEIHTIFSVSEIKTLKTLLSRFNSESLEMDQVIKHIEDGLRIVQEKTEYDRELIQQIKHYSTTLQEKIQKFLIDVFEIGMYMRKWKGPGNPYPHRQHETLKKIHPEEMVALKIFELFQFLNSIDPPLKNICLEFRIVEFTRNYSQSFDQSMLTLESLLYQINNGDYCIRMASSKLVWTAFYYLKHVFNHSIPSFDPTIIDIIY